MTYNLKKDIAMLTWKEFEKVDMRVGTIIEVSSFEKARKPSYKLRIDFGELGIKKSSAQITKLYSKNDLLGKQVVAVVSFPPKQIANFISECLVLGALGDEGIVNLINPDVKIKNGSKIS